MPIRPFFSSSRPVHRGGVTTATAGMKIRRRFSNYDDEKNENSSVVPFVLPDESDPDALLPSQPGRYGTLRSPPNVGPQGPQGKGGGGDKGGDGHKGDGGLDRIQIGRADVPTNEGVPCQEGEEEVRVRGD